MVHGSPVRAIAFSLDGRYVVTGTEGGTARLWDRDRAHGEAIRTWLAAAGRGVRRK
jgi:WD40 repeat protein